MIVSYCQSECFRRFCFIIIIASFLWFPVFPVLSATLVVDRLDDDTSFTACTDASNDCSLRGAIDAANATLEKDDIVLPAGTFYLTINGIDEDANTRGDLDVTSDIAFMGEGLAATIINGSALDRVFHLRNNSTVKLKNLAVRNGRVELLGAGIYQVGGSLTLEGCMIFGNHTYGVPAFGGGIHSTGTLTISDSRILENHAGDPGNPGSGGTGGGIYITGKALTLTRSFIDSNRARFGAGIHMESATGEISYCTISQNEAFESGGGIYLEETPLVIKNSTISDNSSGQLGGGLSQFSALSLGAATMVNSTVSGNIARSGGGLHITKGSMDLSFVTITENRVDAAEPLLIGDGGGLYKNSSPIAVVRIKNSILGGNIDSSPSPYYVSPDCSGDIISMDGNVFGDITGCTGTTAKDAVNTDPKLSPLADNGGLTHTHALNENSPAIDFCEHCTDIAGNIILADQRDQGRRGYKLYQCDSGSFESFFGNYLSCPECSGDEVVIQYDTFISGTDCECNATVSITIGPGVIVEDNASLTVNAPEIKMKAEVVVNQRVYVQNKPLTGT